MIKPSITIVVLRALDSKERALIQQKASSHKLLMYIAKSFAHTISEIEGAESILIDSINPASSDSELFEIVKQLGHKSLIDNEKLIDSLSFDKEYHPWFAIKSPLQKSSLVAHQEFKILELILSKLDDGLEAIEVFSKTDLSVCFLAQRICFNLKNGFRKTNREKMKYILVFLIRALKGYLRPLKKGKVWLVNSNLTKQKMYNLSGTDFVEGDPFLGYLEDEIGSSGEYQNILMLKNPGSYLLPSILDCIIPYNNISNHVFFESKLLSFNGFKLYQEAKEYQVAIRRKLSKAQANTGGFEKFLIQRLSSYSSSLMLSVIRFGLTKQMIIKYKPKSIGGDDEFTLLKFPIFQAARKAGIPTYAIQHGGISLNNINYSFLKEDAIYSPLPTKTLVWGDMTANQLIKSSVYSKKEIEIVGQLRTDVIPSLLAKKEVRYNDGIKIIVFASQPLPHAKDLRERMFDDFIELNKRFNDQIIYWKPHPNERNDIPGFLEKARKAGVNIKVFEGDLYGLLAAADTLITNYSTVGSEAIYFDLELLVLDYSAYDSAGYVREGVGQLCRSFDELETSMNSLIQGKQLIESINRQTYRNNRAYKIDGLVRHRMMKVINELKNE